MNRNNRVYNLFGCEMPFILPPPIPEPPRVIYPKPMVPDLSLTSDMSANVSPKVKMNVDFDKYRTIYPSPPKAESSPNTSHLPSHREQPVLKVYDKQRANQFSSKVDLNYGPNARLFSSHFKGVDESNIVNHRNGFVVKHTNNGVISDRTEDKQMLNKSQNKINPKIIRHSTLDPVLNKNKVEKSCASVKRSHSSATRPQNTVNSPTNEEMYELIKQQDIHLQQISEQIQELLLIHRIDDKKNNNSNKRSVMTMTSMVFEDNKKISPLTKTKNKVSNGVKNKTSTPSTTSKDIRGLHLQTISECQTEPSDVEVDVDVNGLNFTQSPYLGESASIERVRANNDSNDCEDVFYNHMIHNIESMLNNPSSDETDESGCRSSCSPTPPHLKREPHHRKHQIELQSEQTLYIKRLAAKYAVEEKAEHTKPKYKLKKAAHHQLQQQLQQQQQQQQQHEHHLLLRDHRTDLKVYGLSKTASIATKNYLEKYGLTYSPPKVQKCLNFNDNYVQKHNHNRHKTAKNRILDLESLKRQPKLT